MAAGRHANLWHGRKKCCGLCSACFPPLIIEVLFLSLVNNKRELIITTCIFIKKGNYVISSVPSFLEGCVRCTTVPFNLLKLFRKIDS